MRNARFTLLVVDASVLDHSEGSMNVEIVPNSLVKSCSLVELNLTGSDGLVAALFMQVSGDTWMGRPLFEEITSNERPQNDTGTYSCSAM